MQNWTFENICISVNLLMENRFSKPVSMCTLSLSKNEIDEKCDIFQKKFKIDWKKWFITGQWNFSCRYILRSSPGMQNFMIVWHIVWPIWLKNHFFAFFGPFLGIFRPKIILSIWCISWNFAKRWPWCLASCVQNFGPLTQGVWL